MSSPDAAPTSRRSATNARPGISSAKAPFERIVRSHGDTVWRVCAAVLGPVDADDAWAETFLAAMRAYPDLPADANHEAWLVTIAHHKAIDAVRARSRRASPVADTASRATAPPADQPDALHVDDDLIAALQALPPKQRQTVAYHYLGGLPYSEIASLIGGTAAAARRSSADGIARLRQSLPNTFAIKEIRDDRAR